MCKLKLESKKDKNQKQKKTKKKISRNNTQRIRVGKGKVWSQLKIISEGEREWETERQRPLGQYSVIGLTGFI